MNLPLPTELRSLFRAAPELRETYLVGGCVRDALLHQPLADFDLEVFHLEPRELSTVLRRFGRVDVVGRSFPVAKLRLGNLALDFTVAGGDRTGNNLPALTPRLAAARRDFTINALMLHTGTGELLDFFGGVEDLRRRRLRHVGPAFAEDPIRVLRGLQLAGRFDLVAAPETIALGRSLLPCLPGLDPDRVREEWSKWATLSRRPSAGLRFLEAAGWLAVFPELRALREMARDPAARRMSDGFARTLDALDDLVDRPSWRAGSRADRLVGSFAVLTRDCGSPGPLSRPRGVRGHPHPPYGPSDQARESARLASRFLHRLHLPRATIRRVVTLLANATVEDRNPPPFVPRDSSRTPSKRQVPAPPLVASLKTGSRPPRPLRRSPIPAVDSTPPTGSRGPRPGIATS